ncbi:PAS domain-containing protein [Parvibaculum sp.]|uniref:PAS domain-containing protein n=1 Tax=Parvibaculum sp. TaxID=2024848 RepID=UPI001D2C6DE6|nr:PAS domain-containing protein [Parvibaculum sp.]MBX3490831.1 PAS domain-containing protein [Parvibaculum sp.]MCW5728735.1 PAS domain-containing protein [Parvibaculum sp.]
MTTREEMIEAARATTTRFIRLSELADPMTKFMLDYWTLKKGDRPMPALADLNLADFARYAPKILIVQVDRDPFELTFRLVGEDVIANFGFNPKGRSLLSLNEELPGLGTLLHEFFKWVVTARRAVGAGGTQDLVDRSYNNYEAIYLPLSSDGEHVDRIIAATVYYSNTGATERWTTTSLPHAMPRVP